MYIYKVYTKYNIHISVAFGLTTLRAIFLYNISNKNVIFCLPVWENKVAVGDKTISGN